MWFSGKREVVTDERKVEELLTRGVQEVVPREVAESKFRSGQQLRVYLGIDPTGAKLHLGHAVPLRKLRAFSDLGHHVIFLVGSFTAMVGDPTGRDTMREPLTREEVEKNFQTYKKQASKILDFSKVELRYNHEWLEKMQFADIMKLASHFTVQQMLERDMFKERMKREEDLSPNEFLYPLMVGYDSVMLDVDCEIGGNDQLFNMLAGRKLQKAFKKRDKFVLTTKLIEGTDGRKMSKTYDNCIYLDDSAAQMYGKVMSLRDELVPVYFECATNIPMDEVQKIVASHPRDAKVRLAKEIVTIYHGKEVAEKASAGFMTATDATKLPILAGMKLRDIAAELNISMSELRRLVSQGAIDLNDKPLTSVDDVLVEGTLKVGKHRFYNLTN